MTSASLAGTLYALAQRVPEYDRGAVYEFSRQYREGHRKAAARFLDRQDTVVREAVVQALQDAGMTGVLKVLADTNGWVIR